MSLDKESNYQVGYAKPPHKTRFEKGKSGNPAGRVKGSKNVSKLLLQALGEPVVVNENGKRKRITKGEAMIKQLVNKERRATRAPSSCCLRRCAVGSNPSFHPIKLGKRRRINC